MSFSSVGQVFDLPAFRQHLVGLDLSWATSVTIHHTANPSLAMRPKGWTIQHMRNMANYYGDNLKWSSGPHLFTDEDQIFGLSPLTARGVHARSFNSSSIGIEMLGNYDTEDPLTGRGSLVLDNTAAALAILLPAMDLEPNGNSVKFHRDDPRTSKTCPGTKIEKGPFLDLIRKHIASNRADASPALPSLPHAPTLENLARRIDLLEEYIRHI